MTATPADAAAPGPAPGFTSGPTLGPLLHATLIVGDLAPVTRAYAALGFTAHDAGTVESRQADAWGHAALAGCAVRWLTAPGRDAPLLRLIKRPGTPPRPTRLSHGWMALELLVRDVDALAPQVTAAGFEIVGPPADLDVSPAIRALQAIGPAGEMLYLTQVKAPVPPFAIPLSSALPPSAPIGPLFIAVLATPSREVAVAACGPWQPSAVLRFDTKITVLNRAHQLDNGHRWPVATVQWAGESLFEIDEVVLPGGATAALSDHTLPAGLAWVTLRAARPQCALAAIGPGAWIETVN